MNDVVLQVASSASQILTPTVVTTLLEMGGGGIAGGLIGYGVKKLTKLVLAIVGALLAVFLLGVGYLDSKGIVTINWSALSSWLVSGGTWIGNEALSILPASNTILAALPISGSIIAGFAIGWSKG